MRLSDEQIQRLTARILRRLLNEALIEPKAEEAQISHSIEETIQKYRDMGQNVDNETRRLMDQYASQIHTGQVDPQRMYGMIRKQVAEKHKFELNPEEQVNQLSHSIHDRIYHDDLIDYTDEDRAIRTIKKTLKEVLQWEDILDDKVREKIRSLKRGVQEGSREWDILYQKYMEEERRKKGI